MSTTFTQLAPLQFALSIFLSFFLINIERLPRGRVIFFCLTNWLRPSTCSGRCTHVNNHQTHPSLLLTHSWRFSCRGDFPLALSHPSPPSPPPRKEEERFHRKNVAYSSSSSSFHRRKEGRNRLFFPPKHKQTRGARPDGDRARGLHLANILYPAHRKEQRLIITITVTDYHKQN